MLNLLLTIIGVVLVISFIYWLRRRLGFRRVEAEDELMGKDDSAHYIGRP